MGFWNRGNRGKRCVIEWELEEMDVKKKRRNKRRVKIRTEGNIEEGKEKEV